MHKYGKRLITLITWAFLVVPAIYMAAASEAEEKFTQTAFFQYLVNPTPTIKNAIFQKEIFSPDIPEAARKQSFRLSMEDGNYVLTTFLGTNVNQTATGGGSFNGSAWGLVNAFLILSDPAINSNPTSIDHQEVVTKMTADIMANLGIPELERSTIAWDSRTFCFFGRDTSGNGLKISLELVNQLPKRVVILNAVTGEVKAFIDYEYTNSFCNGELPFEFTRHFGAPGHDLGKSFCVTLSSMELTADGQILDPTKLFRPRFTAFYSNDVLYTHNASGKTQKILTTAENNALVASLGPRREKMFSFRIVIFSIIFVSLAALAKYCLFHKNAK